MKLFVLYFSVFVFCFSSFQAHANTAFHKNDLLFLENFCLVLQEELEARSVEEQNINNATIAQMYEACLHDIERLSILPGVGHAISLQGLIPMDSTRNILSQTHIAYGFSVEPKGSSLSIDFFYFKEIKDFEVMDRIIPLLDYLSTDAKINLIQSDGRRIVRGPDF